MKNFSSWILVSLFFFLCQCTTNEPVESPILPKSQSTYTDHPSTTSQYNDIDLNQLLIELEMDHSIESLGFQEKSFNACQVKANKSSNPHCETLYLVRVNFQIMCRDSTGTVEKVNLTPLNSSKLRWKTYGRRGVTATDPRGYGSLGFIRDHTSRYNQLYLYLGSKIALKSFADKWKMILPMSWCLSQ